MVWGSASTRGRGITWEALVGERPGKRFVYDAGNENQSREWRHRGVCLIVSGGRLHFLIRVEEGFCRKMGPGRENLLS